jgi:putative two-component system response regulator
MTDSQVSPREDWTDLTRSAILVLDDDEDVRTIIARCLRVEGYTVVEASGLAEAREQLAANDVIIVLADLTLRHGESGLTLLAELQEQQSEIDVIVMTANSDVSSAVGALKNGAYDYLCKPFAVEVLSAAIKRAVDRNRLAERTLLMDHLEARRQADQDNLEQFLISMASTIDAKSRYTAQHSRRVSSLARLLGEAMGYDQTHCSLLALGGRLHDIGKIGTPDAILDKPGPLTAAEFAVIREHPALGDELVEPIKAIHDLRPMIRWHHERIDGKGYPDGLKGSAIPQDAFLIKTADIWEAITSRRPYRAPMTVEAAVKAMRDEKDVSIPGDIVETFLQAIQGSPVALPAPTQSTTDDDQQGGAAAGSLTRLRPGGGPDAAPSATPASAPEETPAFRPAARRQQTPGHTPPLPGSEHEQGQGGA